MNAVLFLQQVAGVVFSLLAAWFWMVSATGRPVTWGGAVLRLLPLNAQLSNFGGMRELHSAPQLQRSPKR